VILNDGMECRPQCGACCIAPSISSPVPGMPRGKPAGIPCVQLLPDYRCALFGRRGRPAVCASLQPAPEMCGNTRNEALACLARLEDATRPADRRRPLCGLSG
jgi:Fe-S-cluster containining protein